MQDNGGVAALVYSATIDVECLTSEPPTAVDDSDEVNEDSSVITDVLANDTDPDGDTLTITAITNPSNGSIVNNEDGTITYSPNPNYHGSDSYTYTISDGKFESTATVTITVKSVNDAPVCSTATATSYVWPPNHKMVPINAAMSATDVDGETPTISITSIKQDEPTNGLGDGDVSPDATLSPAQVRAERSGTGDGRVYVVILTATDGSGGSCNGTVQVIVPHSMKKPITAVNSGATYDSLEP
jgi:hypothetical protein